MRLVKSLGIALVLAVTAVSAQAADVWKATWSDPDDPMVAPVAAYFHIMDDELRNMSGGSVSLQLFPNGQLGDQQAMVEQVSRGTLQLANITSGLLATLCYPKVGILDLPYLFSSRHQFRAATSTKDKFISDMLDDLATQCGVRVISFHPYGFRNFSTKNTPVHKPADLAGLRIRVPGVPSYMEMIKDLGAQPVSISFSELFTSLQTGVADGQETTPTNMILQKFYQVQGDMTITKHFMTTGAVIVNEQWYQSLSGDQRKMLLEADAEGQLAHDGVGAVNDYLNVGKVADGGVKVYTPTPEELAAFKTAVIGPTRKWAETQLGKDFVDGFFGYMAQFQN